MEKRIIGILLTLLGAAGLIAAGVHFMNGVKGGEATRQVVMYGLLGAIFFFSGVALLKHTSSKPS